VNTEDVRKIALIDQAFKALSEDDIKLIIGADLLVGKLKAHNDSAGIILESLQELCIIRSEIKTLHTAHEMLLSDFKSALRVMHTLSMSSQPPVYSSDLHTLKSKYNVY
jgi:hypothetical protein